MHSVLELELINGELHHLRTMELGGKLARVGEVREMTCDMLMMP